jgi:adenine-specific DNA-methyltransferase
MTKLSGNTHNHQEDLLQLLQAKFPEVFTEGKVDPQKLKATLGESVNTDAERYGLNWAGKSDCFRHIQEPVTKTLKPNREESVDFDETENLFLEGDNLEVLKVLQKSYYGKVKMIYIDPPYNTGSDSFIYPDKFEETAEEYLERVGEKEEGVMTKDGMFQKNSKDNGHYHSNWLSMMYPRLFLARNLMRDDGVIFVSIDDNEVHNLRMMMNEIFGEENFISEIIWEKKYSPQNDAKYFSLNHEQILCFAKNKEIFERYLLPVTEEQRARYKNPDNDPRGDWKSADFSVATYNAEYDYSVETPSGKIVNPPKGRCWATSKMNFEKLKKDNRIWFGQSGENTPSQKKFLSETNNGMVPISIWKYGDVGHTQGATQDLKKLFDNVKYFDYPKPVGLIKKCLQIATKNDDLILDFFAGSGTTAHAVMALNAEDGGDRKCISVQLPEPCDEKSEAYKAGYKTIADIAKERIRRAGQKIKSENPPSLDGRGLGGGCKNNTDQKTLLEYAKEMRKEPTDSERKLWQILRNKQLEGHKFRRQKPLGNYILDFVCFEKKLIVEADGGQHAEEKNEIYDKKRTEFLENKGFRVLRFWNNEILKNPEGVVEIVMEALIKPLTPALSPCGRGSMLDTGFKVFKLDESNFKIWRGDVQTEAELIAQMEMFVDNVRAESTQENILYELVLKSGLDLNIKTEKKSVQNPPSLDGRGLGGGCYFVLGEGELIVCLENALSQPLLDEILAAKPQKVIVLDKAFQNDDQLKTNTLLQAEDEGVEFKVI